VPSDGSGQLDVTALEGLLDERTRLVAITHVPTNGGLVNPAEAVGEVTRREGVPFLLDACQSVGQLDVDVERIGCDLLSATGRKFLRGPRGTGFLYVRRALLDRLDPPLVDMRGATWTSTSGYELRPGARRFENWEFNVASVMGLSAAVDYALGWGLGSIEARVTALAEKLRRRLDELPHVQVHDLGERRCAIVSFTVAGYRAEEVKRYLGERNIHVSTSSRASTRFDMDRRGLDDLVRASVHYFNHEEEVEILIAALRELERGTE
jgi:selenocysteine lyase/cysteine desulfurase